MSAALSTAYIAKTFGASDGGGEGPSLLASSKGMDKDASWLFDGIARRLGLHASPSESSDSDAEQDACSTRHAGRMYDSDAEADAEQDCMDEAAPAAQPSPCRSLSTWGLSACRSRT